MRVKLFVLMGISSWWSIFYNEWQSLIWLWFIDIMSIQWRGRHFKRCGKKWNLIELSLEMKFCTHFIMHHIELQNKKGLAHALNLWRLYKFKSTGTLVWKFIRIFYQTVYQLVWGYKWTIGDILYDICTNN